MTVRVWTKKETRQTLNELRREGFFMHNNECGLYRAFNNGDREILVFSALRMRNGYICRLNEDYFDIK
tara:strand:- start:5775 stop:5978 length:204 start_codon:yes stop_codon:yes gene_type:complete